MSIPPGRNSPIAAGYQLDRYELLCPIAEGGMASVWIARQTGKHGFQKLVAVKTILPKYAAEPTFQSMFVDEARIASRIEHANVTQILDVGEQHGITYLVMEYVDGDALSKINRAAKKRDTKIPLGIVLRILADVCGGLHAAHELTDDAGVPLGVVHRDVSPQNILVTTRGVAKLIDFGIAKARNRLAGDTNVDQLKGKVQYMPPEQALGKPVDRRADIWAVGAVLYHLIAGKPPYEGENEIQTIFQLTSGRRPMPLSPSVPYPVRDVVKRSLSNDVSGRYPTAAALQEALEDAIIQSNLATSTAAVAAFLQEMVGDRAERRTEAISLGLKAAADRENVAEMMRSNAENTLSTGSAAAAVVSAATAARMAAVTTPGPESTSSGTGQTLGSAPMSLPLRDRRLTVVATSVATTLVLAAVVGVIASRSTKPAAATAPAPPSVASVAVASAPAPEPSASSLPAAAAPPPTGAPDEPPAPSASASSVASASSSAPAAVVVKPWHPTSPAPAAPAHPASSAKPRENYGF